MMLDDSALRERAAEIMQFVRGAQGMTHDEREWFIKRITPILAALRDATQLEWEGRAASLADVLNQELRENGPLGVYQVGTHDDMREGIRVLVDYVREGSARVARAQGGEKE
mgnify:CR=1 FL=1